jgi:hypothetical protein
MNISEFQLVLLVTKYSSYVLVVVFGLIKTFYGNAEEKLTLFHKIEYDISSPRHPICY